MKNFIISLLTFLSIPSICYAEIASYYSSGSRTANGEKFNPSGLTAAHRTLPFHSRVRVTNLNNGHSVIVRINDRGPFIKGRGIDLSKGAARHIRMNGTAPVKIERVK